MKEFFLRCCYYPQNPGYTLLTLLVVVEQLKSDSFVIFIIKMLCVRMYQYSSVCSLSKYDAAVCLTDRGTKTMALTHSVYV